MPIGPRDIEESLSSAEKIVIDSLFNKIDSELLREQYEGPHPFSVLLADSLSPRVVTRVEKAYKSLWPYAHVYQGTGGRWYIVISTKEIQSTTKA